MEESQAALIAEQIGRMKDSILARLQALEEKQEFHNRLDAEKHAALENAIKELKADLEDHEARIRAATDGVTTFKVWSGLASGGSSVVAILSLIKSFL